MYQSVHDVYLSGLVRASVIIYVCVSREVEMYFLNRHPPRLSLAGHHSYELCRKRKEIIFVLKALPQHS